jgi:acyl-CoA thioesterase
LTAGLTSCPNSLSGVLGRGQVFTRDGELVTEFSQDAMAKTSDKEMD